jgi:alpha-L-fucosidase
LTSFYLGSKNPKYVDFMKRNYPPGFTYPDFGPMFTAEFFEPQQWAEILKSSGAKYTQYFLLVFIVKFNNYLSMSMY